MKCYDCEFYDSDYVFDGEDEYEVDICEADHGEYLDSDEECPYYKKYILPKYDEKDTECDKCEYLSECMGIGEYIDCTTLGDTRTHVMCDMDSCKMKP